MKRVMRAIAVAVAVTVLPAVSAGAAPLVFPSIDQEGFAIDTTPPQVTAASWILYDDSTSMVLAEQDADVRRPMASITKIMTVLLAFENGDMNEKVVVSEEAAGQGGQEIGLVAGETVTLGALVRAAMIHSGNDAAAAIAEHIGGSIDGFVEMMNERAIELGMLDTHFANPNGLDASGHYSTPRDMLTLARQAMSIPEFEDLVRSRALVFPDAPDGTSRTATNTNRILNSYDGVIGVKTGETPNAGLTYVGAAERNGRRLFVVVFDSVGRRAHFADAIALYNWAFNDLGIQGTLAMGIPYRAIGERVSESPLLVEAPTNNSTEQTLQGPTIGSNSVGNNEASIASANDTVRQPDPAPDSVLSTLTFWLGLITGASGG